MSLLEVIAVIVSLIGVWLTTRRNLLCWPVGLVSVGLYSWIFYHARLYSDCLLQCIFAVCLVYGWTRWLGARGKDDRVIVLRLPARMAVAGIIFGTLGGTLLGLFMARFTDAVFPWLDATLTSFSLLGQFWTARRYLANWILWIVVDIVYVGLYLFKQLYLTAGLYAAFVLLAYLGWRSWKLALGVSRESNYTNPARQVHPLKEPSPADVPLTD